MAWLFGGLNCAAVLYGALPPMFAIIGVAIGTMLVFLLLQRCYQFYRDPYSDVVRREPWRAPVPFWRCLMVHHVYASVLFPCGPRCCIVHAAECTVHVSVLMACTAFGYWKMAPVTEFMSASEERWLQGGIVVLALLLRFVYVRPGWLFRWVPVAPEHFYPDEPMPSEWGPSAPPSIQSPNNSFASVAQTKHDPTLDKDGSFSSGGDIDLDEADGLMLAVQGAEFADPPHQRDSLAVEQQQAAPSTSSGARTQMLDYDLVIDDDLIFRPREEPDVELVDPSFSGTYDNYGNLLRSSQEDPLALHRFGVVDTATQRDQLVRTKSTNELRFGANLEDIEAVGAPQKRASVWALPNSGIATFTPPDDDLYGSPIKRMSTFSAMGATPPSEEAVATTGVSMTPSFGISPLPKALDKKGSGRAGPPPSEFRSPNASQLTLSNIDLQTTRTSSVVRLPPALEERGRGSTTHGDGLTSPPGTTTEKSGGSSTKTVVLHVDDIPTWTNDLAFDDEDLAFETSTGVATMVAAGGGARLKPRGRHTPPIAGTGRRQTAHATYQHAVATNTTSVPRRFTQTEGIPLESPPPAAQKRVRISERHDGHGAESGTEHPPRRATLPLPGDKAVARRPAVKASPGSTSLSTPDEVDAAARGLDVSRDNARVIELSGFTEDIAFGDDVFADDGEDADLDCKERSGDADGLPRLRSKHVFLGKPPPLFAADATQHPNQLVADDSPHKHTADGGNHRTAQTNLFARVLANGEANPLLEPQDPTLLHNANVLVTSRFTEEMRFDGDMLEDNEHDAPRGRGATDAASVPGAEDPARLQREHAYSSAARVKLWDAAVYATEGGPDASRIDEGIDDAESEGGMHSTMEHTHHRRASVFHNATFRSIASVQADAPFQLDGIEEDVPRTNTKREAWLDAIEVQSEQVSDGAQQPTSKQTLAQQHRKSSLWTTDMAFGDIGGGGEDVHSNEDIDVVVDASAADPHSHRRADLYTHDAAMLYDDLFENDDMAGIAFPLGATAASMYGAERRHHEAQVQMDRLFAEAPFTDQMAFDDADVSDDGLVVVDVAESDPNETTGAPSPGTSAAKYRTTRGASVAGLMVRNGNAASAVSRRATFGSHPMAAAFALGDDVDVSALETSGLEGTTTGDHTQKRRATFGNHPAEAFAQEEGKGDAAWAWNDAISDNGSYRFDLDGIDAYALGDDAEAASITFVGDVQGVEIPELVLEFHPVHTYHVAYCVYLAVLFVIAFMLANLFGIEQRRDEYGQCASYKSDFLQVLLIWDLIFGQALYCLLYFMCRIAVAWPRRVHWNVHPTDRGMAACFRKDCHHCWQQRTQRTRRDHYDDFEELDPYWVQAFEAPNGSLDQTQSKPLDDVDGTAFMVLDVDSDDDITVVKKK